MRLEEEKIEQFTNDIMANVALKRQKVLAGVDKDVEKKYKDKETELYTKAYDIIQEGMKGIDREKNEIISKALMDNKVQLFHKRTDIVNDVFKTVRDQLRAFCATDDYYPYLVKMIEEGLAVLEAGNKEIIINSTDAGYKEALEKKFRCEITVEIKQIDFIGGCKIVDKEHKIFIDDSFESKLMDQRESFVQMCQINVE